MSNFEINDILQKEQLSAQELKFLMDTLPDRVIVLDVRSEVEYKFYHMEGAIHLPCVGISLEKVFKDLQISQDREIILVTYCNAGGRGGRTFSVLKEENLLLKNSKIFVKNLTHGLNNWIIQDYPIVKE